MVGRMKPRLALAAVALVWVAAGAAWAALLAPADARPVLTAFPDRVVLAGPEERKVVGVPSPVSGPHASSSDPGLATVPPPAAAPLLRESRSAAPRVSPCEEARSLPAPALPAGWTETCGALSDPRTLGLTYPDRRIVYHAAALAERPPAQRRYVVAHERCHAARAAAGLVRWDRVAEEERLADDCAATAGASLRWSPYR